MRDIFPRSASFYSDRAEWTDLKLIFFYLCYRYEPQAFLLVLEARRYLVESGDTTSPLTTSVPSPSYSPCPLLGSLCSTGRTFTSMWPVGT